MVSCQRASSWHPGTIHGCQLARWHDNGKVTCVDTYDAFSWHPGTFLWMPAESMLA